MIKWLLSVWCVIMILSCGEGVPQTPKPRAYPRVDFPTESGMESFVSDGCPFTFEYPVYSKVVRDTTFFNEEPGHPCWFDLVTKELKGRLHLSYYPITTADRFEELVQDAFQLSGKHNVKANFIEEIAFRNSPEVSGIIFQMEGPVASPYQFFITDSTTHFLRGALYVNAKSKPDSLKPIYDFLIRDADQVIRTFSWKN
jgi:gliding motility-associated lipoprotein GldD